MSESKDDISDEVSERICKHMNEDHAVTLYGMAKSTLSCKESAGKITQLKMNKISLSGCKLSFVLCKGDMCQMKKIDYPFTPPLPSAGAARPRLIATHNDVCGPKFSWLFEPVCLFLLIVSAILAYGTHVVGMVNLASIVEGYGLDSEVAGTFARCFRGFWFLWITAHCAEGVYVAYHCINTIKVNVKIGYLWFLCISMVGYPITSKFLPLLSMHYKSKQKEKV